MEYVVGRVVNLVSKENNGSDLVLQHILGRRKVVGEENSRWRGLKRWHSLCGELVSPLDLRGENVVQDIACIHGVQICLECRKVSEKFCDCGYSVADVGVGYYDDARGFYVCKRCGHGHTAIQREIA